MDVIETFKEYKDMINKAMDTVDENEIMFATAELLRCYRFGYNVLVAGNGGSAAIAEHLTCDHSKGISHDTEMFGWVHSLVSNVSLMTAIANDFSYEEVFSKQIEYFVSPETLIVISSSGNSPNIIKALNTAERMSMKTIALVGFDGGRVVKENLADFIIHVKSDNYGVVEDCHQIIMHTIAQYIRSSYAFDQRSVKL